MNQNHISHPPAHDGQIVQIITLSKFGHKYFATRCIYGDFGIWGANKHPDRVLKVLNMDDPEFPQVQEEPAKPEPKKKSGDEDEDEENEEEEELDEDGNPIEKKEPEPVKIEKDFSNRIASAQDKMIELKNWTETIIQSSATVIAVSNYRESFVYITIIDLKMRRQQQIKRFDLTHKPTALFQMDEGNLLIGTEGGMIEHRAYSANQPIKVYEAHPESQAGISAIIELKSNSPLLRGENDDPAFKLIATASEGAPQFRIWKMHREQRELIPFLKIETTFVNGIKFLLETHDTQLAAANESTIKFYDFIDKNQKELNLKSQKAKEELQALMKQLFQTLDKEGIMKLSKPDCKSYIQQLSTKFQEDQFVKAAAASEEAFDDVWYDLGCTQSENISWHQIKPLLSKLVEQEQKLEAERKIEAEER